MTTGRINQVTIPTRSTSDRPTVYSKPARVCFAVRAFVTFQEALTPQTFINHQDLSAQGTQQRCQIVLGILTWSTKIILIPRSRNLWSRSPSSKTGVTDLGEDYHGSAVVRQPGPGGSPIC